MRLDTLCCLGVSVLQKAWLFFFFFTPGHTKLGWIEKVFVLIVAGRERTLECPCPQPCWCVPDVPEEGLGSQRGVSIPILALSGLIVAPGHVDVKLP